LCAIGAIEHIDAIKFVGEIVSTPGIVIFSSSAREIYFSNNTDHANDRSRGYGALV